MRSYASRPCDWLPGVYSFKSYINNLNAKNTELNTVCGQIELFSVQNTALQFKTKL